MNINVGGSDRFGRVMLGVIILMVLPFLLGGQARWFALVGLVPLVTGMVQWCPLYTLFGISTCKSQK